MVFAGWLALGSVEIINDARTVAYSKALGIPAVRRVPPTNLRTALGDAVYTTPAGDDAPWYDPAVPASGRFAGLIGLTIIGVGTSSHTRALTPRLGTGSSVSAPRYAHREIAVGATMVAADAQALSYGKAWLASALRGDLCLDNVDGDSLCLFTAAPTCPGDAAVCGDAEHRTAYRVALFEGPRVVVERPLSMRTCEPGEQPVVAEVEFTLAASHPFLYRQAVSVASEVPFVFPAPSATCSINWIPVGSGACPQPCGTEDDCMTDPATPALPLLPSVPMRVDPSDCTSALIKSSATVTVAAGTMPAWLDVVPVVRISSGGKAMRRVAVRFASHPGGAESCSDILTGRCIACSEIRIPYLPVGATLTLDGRTERASVDCPYAGEAAANPQLFGPDGGPVDWPVIDCANTLCIEVTAEADDTAVDATVAVELVAREDAA